MVVVQHGFVIVIVNVIVEPPLGKLDEPAGPLAETVMSLARVIVKDFDGVPELVPAFDVSYE